MPPDLWTCLLICVGVVIFVLFLYADIIADAIVRLLGYDPQPERAAEENDCGNEWDEPPDRTGMTYYRKDGCPAPSAEHPDCICWSRRDD